MMLLPLREFKRKNGCRLCKTELVMPYQILPYSPGVLDIKLPTLPPLQVPNTELLLYNAWIQIILDA